MPRLLLVDDEPLIRRSMQKSMLRAGFEVETAGDCSAGLVAFRQSQDLDAPFDLALLDLNMPDFTGQQAPEAGLELLTQFRMINPNLKVIVLTAYDEVNKAKDAVSRGAAAYFVKGREQGLIELINDLLTE